MPNPTTDELRRVGLDYIKTWLLKPYIWGGDDFIGPDCSGMGVEYLQSIGLKEHGTDATAHGLWLENRQYEVQQMKKGDLAFWFTEGLATHVEIAIDGYHTIGAAGGGRPQFDLDQEVDKLKVEIPGLSGYFELYDTPENNILLWLLRTALFIRQASQQNAQVRIRPVTYRGPNFKICDPFKALK